MKRSYRLRRLLAPTLGLQKASLFILLGFTAFSLGIALSFRAFIRPLLSAGSDATRRAIGAVVPRDDLEMAIHLVGGALLLSGTYLLYRGVANAIGHIVETLNPALKNGKVDVYFRRQQLAQGPRIVAIGGGTGLSTLLRGLKHHTSNITAIVTVTDDGGSSGKLIQEKGMIPPGDIRNCLVALADAEKAMTDLFQHRFKNDSGTLSGHSMGNLLIAALVDQARGDFERAVEIASDVLAIRGRVVPSTMAHVRLRALMADGTEVCGETQIVQSRRPIQRIHLDPPDCEAYRRAVEAIRDADLICIGPGSVYTSIIPNLLVPGIAEALRETRAPKAYICNVMTQPGETDHFAASEHVTTILNNVEGRVFDYVLVNTGVPSEAALQKYAEQDQQLVENDGDRIRGMGLRVLQGNYMSETDLVRHDPMRVAARLLGLLDR